MAVLAPLELGVLELLYRLRECLSVKSNIGHLVVNCTCNGTPVIPPSEMWTSL